MLREVFAGTAGKTVIGFYVILIVVFSILGIRKTAIKGNDSWLYFGAARAIANCEDIYNQRYPTNPEGRSVRPYQYPPLFAILLIPLASLGNHYAGLIWGILNVLVTLLVIYISMLVCKGKYDSYHKMTAVIPVIICLRFFDSNIQNGQVNAVVFLLVLLGLYLFQSFKDFFAGLALSLATAIKLTPLIFLGYFLYKREWRVCAGFITGLVLFILLLPSLYLGFKTNNQLLSTYSKKMIIKPFDADDTWGQSLSASLVRYLYEYKSYYHEERGTLRVNVLDIHSERVDVIAKILLLIMLLLIGFVCRGSIVERQGYTFTMEVSLVIVTMLLMSPLTRVAHFVVLIFPLIALVHYYAKKSFENLPVIQKWIPVLLVVAFMLFTGSSPGFVGRALSDYLYAYSTIFWGSFLMWITFVVFLWKHPHNSY
jgi:hypothetical protein